jgi:CDP-2,3-bis-(O-geranylgeranyl)-sn-glycerol synthase
MLSNIFFALFFFAPAGLANLAAFASGKIAFLKKYNFPVDCYIKIKGNRLLGSHKTVRGFIAAVLVGMLVCYLEVLWYGTSFWVRENVPVDYYTVNPVMLGGLLGFGALFGDAIKSFFKRLKSIQPGGSWFPFDQIDYILGGIIFSLISIQIPVVHYLFIFIVWFLMHPLMTFFGYLLKLRRKPL